ncbi:MAG TPA: MamI family restriction endonuclease [Pirellulales bacterium]|nr:MamI family restriction endonuclease [Pirellulales bacterium]
MPAGTMNDVLSLLDAHYEAFFSAKPHADKTGHPVPCDTRAWSQILISLLTGINGRRREKGADFVDGSDVKAACCWGAIDTPRFNGAIPAGRLSTTSRKAENLTAFDSMPFLFFVLWDDDTDAHPRCRIWCVRPRQDRVFRKMCAKWYRQRATGEIKSTNFQLHPPRFRDDDIFRNKCGNLAYPLLFTAIRKENGFECLRYDPAALEQGKCTLAPD